MKIETVPIDSLILDPENARNHPEPNLGAIRRSLERFGQQKPIVVGPDGVVVAGNGLLTVARELGWEKIAVVRTDLEGAERVAFAIADNRTAELAEWNDENLVAAFRALSEDPTFDLEATGFDEATIEELMRDSLRGEAQEVETPETPVNPVTRAGDIWLLGRHRLLCGDSTVAADVDRLNAGETPFIMVTDPPYGVEYGPEWRTSQETKGRAKEVEGGRLAIRARGEVQGDESASWPEAWHLFQGVVAYVWTASLRAEVVRSELESSGFSMRASIVWRKPQPVFSRGHYHWQHEPCWYAVRKGEVARWCGDRKQSTVWDVMSSSGWCRAHATDEDQPTGHGTQKPVECMARPIRNHGAPGDIVYDPFLGSGTTLIAAEQLDRRCFAIEIAPRYVDVALRRWQNLTGEDATLDGDGRTFAEIADDRGVALD